MDLHLELRDDSPKRAQLERQLRDAIRAGRLVRGARLPASRVLAEQLGVARGTVIEAYAQLVAEGYLVAQRGSGTRVSETVGRVAPRLNAVPAPMPRVRFDLRSGVPDPSAFPRQAWAAATASVLRTLPDAEFVARHRGGYAGLRRQLAQHLAMARATSAEPPSVVVTAGLAHGLRVALEELRSGGARRIAVEDPCWPLHAAAVEAAGLELVHVAVDGEGIDVDALARTASDAVIVTPAHQYPTGVVLSPARRAALIEWAQTTRGLIVEDDYDAEFRFDGAPVATLQGMASDRVIYLGTASKTLIPTLRIGWMIPPHALRDAIERRNARLGAWPSLLEQAALAELIEQGRFQRHLRLARRRYRARRETLARLLRDELGVDVGGAAAGLQLAAWLPDGVDEAAVIAEARAHGVRLHGIHGHCTLVAERRPGLVVGYGSTTERGLREAVGILASLPALAQAARRAA